MYSAVMSGSSGLSNQSCERSLGSRAIPWVGCHRVSSYLVCELVDVRLAHRVAAGRGAWSRRRRQVEPSVRAILSILRRIRLEAQDTALSRRRPPVRIRYAVPTRTYLTPPTTARGRSHVRHDCRASGIPLGGGRSACVGATTGPRGPTRIAGMQLSIETQVLSLPLRDPFRIARDEDDRTATTVIVSIATNGLEGVGEAFPVAYYGETVGTVGVVRAAPGGRHRHPRGAAHERRQRHGLAVGGEPAHGRSHRSSRRGQGGPRYRTPRPRRPRAWAAALAAAGHARGGPADRLLPGHRHPRGGGRTGQPRDELPDAQDQGRRAERPRPRSRRCARSIAGPLRVDANTGWSARGRRPAHPGAGAPGRRAHRAALPGSPAATAALAPGAQPHPHRGRRERGHHRRPRRAGGGRGGRQREAHQVRWRGASAGDDRAERGSWGSG